MAREAAIAVIGAGPAGLMAAEVLADAGQKAVVYDHMPAPARKFLMAGRGGLNLTHSEPLAALLKRYGAASENLAPAITAFPPQQVIAWCEGLGQPTFIGSSARVFPKAMKASGLLRAWLRRLAANGVEFRAGHRWTGWSASSALTFKTASGEAVDASPAAVVLALGGASWPKLGSDGHWAATLRQAGIEVLPLKPSNCGFEVAWSAHIKERFAGTALKRIALNLGGQSSTGDLSITAYGIEGGAAYGLSAPLRDTLEKTAPVMIACDLRPDLTEDALASRLLRPRGGQSWSNYLRKAAGLSPAAIAILRDAAQNDFPENPLALAALIKSVPLRIERARGLERAISSAGGVAWSSIDQHFMLHKKPGVFVCGEMLDWDAPTGGYLLQGCFSTGAAAGLGAIKYLSGK